MIATVLGGVFLWLVMGLVYFVHDMMKSRAGPDAGCLGTLILIAFWPLRIIGILK